MRQEYEALGWWKITTEGDCEGKTVTDLGVHYGYLDELAFSFGRKSYYSLTFQAVKRPVPAPFLEPVREVCVTLGIDSGTWDLGRIGRVEAVRQILKDRPVVVGESHCYAAVTLTRRD